MIATFFPPVIVALLNRGVFGDSTKAYSPKTQHTGGPDGMGGWRDYEYKEYGTGPPQDKNANASFYHAFDLLIVIKITLAVIFIYSVQYTLNRATGFKSNGKITITVTKGGTNFGQLGGSGPVTININSVGSSIKKYIDSNKPPDPSNLQPITNTSDPLNKGTKLYIEVTGRISNTNIPGSEVTIKATLDVNSAGTLGTSLELAGNTSNDPSSTGLRGSITPQDGGTSVTISNGGSITLKEKSLEALLSLTQNAVTLTGSATGFKSSASITVTRTSGTADFKKLDVGSTGLKITITGGSIKRYDENNQLTDLQTDTNLTVDTQLVLEANGTITEPQTAKDTNVELRGTIVVTSDGVAIGDSALEFAGGPNRGGVSGSLALTNGVKITGSDSKIEITPAAYSIIKGASDTTSSSFTIGSADPRDPTQAKAGDLATEYYFKKYWHLLPTEKYDPTDLPDGTSISPALMVLLIATIFPPMIVVILQIVDKKSGFNATKHSPKFYKGWGEHSLRYWHFVDVLIVIKISLAAIFIYSLHYIESDNKADGDLTLTPNTTGNYNTNTITLTITGATYKTGDDSTEKILGLSSSSSNTNNLLLTSDGDITGGKTHNLNRGNLRLKLTAADSSFNNKTYNVSLKIESDITLGTGCSGCKLKTTPVPVSLGTYSITTSGTSYTGTPEDSTDYHGQHQSDNCCYFGNQNTWSTEDNRYGWHSFTILIPIKILLPSILYVYFIIEILWTVAYGYYSNTQKTVITYPKDKAITGTVTIKTFKDGKCDETAPTTLDLTGAKATIDRPKGGKGPTLTITTITYYHISLIALTLITKNPKLRVYTKTLIYTLNTYSRYIPTNIPII
uniref:Tpr-related protein family member n=1 Tax=Theileria annulata TaxID=5874 RepID=A0A3B0MUP0_THEAN